MENVHAERSAGWSVLCYVAVLIVATLLNGGMPSTHIKASDIALTLDSHRFALLLGAWLTFPAYAFFLWFLVGFRSYLSHAREGRQEGLPTLAMIAGVVMVACGIFAASLATAAIYASPDTFKDNALGGVYDAFVFLQGSLGYAPVSVFLFASAHSMRRHESAPSWLSSLGYLAAAGAAVATLSMFFNDPFMAPGQSGPGLFGALPAAIFLVATGTILIGQNKRGSGGSMTSAES